MGWTTDDERAWNERNPFRKLATGRGSFLLREGGAYEGRS